MRRYILGILLIFLQLSVKGQPDPIFTQYMFNLQSINPAYAGLWEQRGFNSLIRKQWLGIDNSPLTQILSLHTPLKNEVAGVGFNIMHDRFAFENRIDLSLDYAYEIMLSYTQRLRMGMKLGFMYYSNPLSKYKLNPAGEPDPIFQNDIELRFLPNVGFGLFYYSDNYYVSFSMPRAAKTNDMKEYINYSAFMQERYFYLSGGYVFRLSSDLIFKPVILIRSNIGSPSQIDLSANFLLKEKLWVGAMFRTNDAICFITQWHFNSNMRVGYAMDITLTNLSGHHLGTHEFSFSYSFDYYGRRRGKPRYF